MRKLLLAAAIGFGAMACTDRATENPDPGSNPQLPAITQTGANTFGAMINGKVMVPRNSIGYVPPGSNHYPAQYFETKYYYDFGAANSRDNNVGSIYIYMEKINNLTDLPLGNYPFSEGIYYVNPNDQNLPPVMMEVFINNNNSVKTYLSMANTGNITITRNDSNIIAGTFSCKLKNKDNPADILEVKDGRFDFTKATINTTNFP